MFNKSFCNRHQNYRDITFHIQSKNPLRLESVMLSDYMFDILIKSV